MKTFELKYPLNVEVKEFRIPLPDKIAEKGDSLALIFDSELDYYGYLDTLCDLSDTLLYKVPDTAQRKRVLNCLKDLLTLLSV